MRFAIFGRPTNFAEDFLLKTLFAEDLGKA
jgi:hypothetical protein